MWDQEDAYLSLIIGILMGDLEIDFLTERFQADQKSKSFFFDESENTNHKSHLLYLRMTTTKVSSLNFCISENISIPKIRIENRLDNVNLVTILILYFW